MNKVNKHIELGLTQEELSSVLKSAGEDNVINKFEGKLDNCDLSRPAIELVNSADLEAILKISNGINNKYLGSRVSGLVKKSIVGLIALIGISGSIFVFLSSDNSEIITVDDNQVRSPEKEILIVENQEEASITPNEENTQKKSIEIVLENTQEDNIEASNLIVSDSIIKDTTIITPMEVESDEEVKNDKVEQPSEAPVNVKYTKPQRIVRGVLATGMIDPKYKGDNYKISSLVDYQGGNEQLQNEIFRRLKRKIKDDDIPSASSTIVFNFEVTSRGKVKKVSVQSRTTPELEAIIIQTIEGLDSWKKGSKRASKNYSVFVTFK